MTPAQRERLWIWRLKQVGISEAAYRHLCFIRWLMLVGRIYG